ncbi:hypothetical protein HanRHA438_Chr10g0433231 [Helianthus annuus]|nr:hypothetical protein HanRHA438_Chr10g0433231 [Helianthus annuus]
MLCSFIFVHLCSMIDFRLCLSSLLFAFFSYYQTICLLLKTWM